MQTHYLEPLFNPRSIAVIGASPREGSPGVRILRNLIDGGYAGSVYAVHPRHSEVLGLPCLSSLSKIGKTVDLAIITSPAQYVFDAISDCGRHGVQHAVVMTKGFDPTDTEARPSRRRLAAHARACGVRLLGPSCPGLIRPSLGLNATFYPHQVAHGSLALVSHSGAMTRAVLDWAQSTGVGFSSVVTTGSEMDVEIGEILDYLISDYRTRSILLYFDRIDHTRRLMSALRGAARIKPIVVMKSAHDSASYCDAIARTGGTTSMDDVFHAAIERVGAVRVYNFSNLFAAAKILSSDRRVNGSRLAILSNGRGPALMATDRLEHDGLHFAELDADTRNKLAEALPGMRLQHPLVIDDGENTAEKFRTATEILRDSKAIDAVLTIYAPDPRGDALEIASAVSEVPRPRGKPVLTCWMGEQEVAASRAMFQSKGVPTFRTPEAAIDAFRFLCDHHRNQKLLLQVPYPLSKSAPPDRDGARALIRQAQSEGRRALSQLESIELLRAFHIPTTRAKVAHDADEAAAAAAEIGYPVALKIDSPNIGYKSEVDGVRLHIRDEAALRREYADLLARVHELRPDAELHGALVEEMLDRPQGRELMVRISDDPEFGPVIKLAVGGGLPPERGERAIALPPLNRVLADDLIDKSRASRLLGAYRNLEAVDRDALRDVLLRVSEMVCELPELFELTINPLIVDHQGAVAVDVQAVIERRNGHPNYSHMAIHPYPTEWLRAVELKNGALVEFRPIRPEDAEKEAEFVRGLSSESKYFRFMHAVGELTPEMLSKFTKIDYDREMAFVAVGEDAAGDEQIIGVARYVINPDWESCEFAVAIADDWKGIGLASRLMRLLIEHARFRGLTLMEGTVLKNNNNMAGLMEALGFSPAMDPDDPDILAYTLPLKRQA